MADGETLVIELPLAEEATQREIIAEDIRKHAFHGTARDLFVEQLTRAREAAIAREEAARATQKVKAPRTHHEEAKGSMMKKAKTNEAKCHDGQNGEEDLGKGIGKGSTGHVGSEAFGVGSRPCGKGEEFGK